MADDAIFRVQVQSALAEFKQIQNRVNDNIDKELIKIGYQIANDAKKSMRTRLDDSIEGLPPRVQTGRLRASITSAVKSDYKKATLYIGTAVWYGKPLETLQQMPGKPLYKGRIHPFLKPALDQYTAEQYTKTIRDAITKAVKP
jgi:hypothetical protein